jgi:hypothetical protein
VLLDDHPGEVLTSALGRNYVTSPFWKSCIVHRTFLIVSGSTFKKISTHNDDQTPRQVSCTSSHGKAVRHLTFLPDSPDDLVSHRIPAVCAGISIDFFLDFSLWVTSPLPLFGSPVVPLLLGFL